MKQQSCQLLVIGGGVAGACAAIAAARCGVQVTLVERQGYLGGSGYSGMFQYVCGLYLNGDSFPAETLNGGITRELVELLKRRAPGKPVQKIGQVYVLPYTATDLHDVLKDLLEAESEVTVRYNTSATGVVVQHGSIRSVDVEVSGVMHRIATDMVVDCTGNGDVAVMAGAESELSPLIERQLAGFSVQLSGLKGGDDTLSIKVPYFCSQAVNSSLLPPVVRFTTFIYGGSPGTGFIKMCLDGEDSSGRDECALENAHALLDYLRQVLPSFMDARITGTSLKVLDREGRRIIGDYMLTEEDILMARRFPDAVAKNAWPIELWDRMKGTIYKYVPQGDYYEIPFRCLTVKGIINLLTAGRCISVSRTALGSTRVMGTCMALGEQAGRAGAYFVNHRTFPGILLRSP